MRILHTADWHLGHTLHQQSRHEEHAAFLAWLTELVAVEAVDALLIAGDVFESANPPTRALQLYYQTLMDLRAVHPDLDIIVIGGNHDSAPRLDAPGPLWRSLGVHVVGGLPRLPDGALDLDRLILPLRDADGAVAAWVVAMPFLRPSDLPRIDPQSVQDPLIEGVATLYERAFAAAQARCAPDQALIAMGHCYMADTKLSENSERKVLGGNQHALTWRIFPEAVQYVALGHLHFAQPVHAEHIRYCGSPIPLSMAEAGYTHQVVIADFEAGALTTITPHPIPRVVPMLRLPADGPARLTDVIAALEALPDAPGEMAHWQRPFLEVSVVLDAPDPTLRSRVERALEGKAPRLVSLKVIHDHDGGSLADQAPEADLSRMTPEEVFRRKWARSAPGEPPADLLAAFAELVEGVAAEDT